MQPKDSIPTSTQSLQLEKAFKIPSKFDFRHALLGRQLRRKTNDDLRSEGMQILLIVLGLVGLAFAQFLAWAILSEQIVSDPFGSTALAFWLVQVAVVAVFIFVTSVGFTPNTTVQVNSSTMTITVGKSSRMLRLKRIMSPMLIDADVYQKHYRRYRESTFIGNSSVNEMLLFWHDEKPIILGLKPGQLSHIIGMIQNESNEVGRENSTQPAFG